MPCNIWWNLVQTFMPRRRFGTSLNSNSCWTPFVFSGTFQRSRRRRMSREDKKCDKGEAPTPTPKKKHAAAAADNTFLESVALISASPTEVSINHPNWQHLMVVNTSAVSALASRGRLLGPWPGSPGPGSCTLWPLPMVSLRGACRNS